MRINSSQISLFALLQVSDDRFWAACMFGSTQNDESDSAMIFWQSLVDTWPSVARLRSNSSSSPFPHPRESVKATNRCPSFEAHDPSSNLTLCRLAKICQIGFKTGTKKYFCSANWLVCDALSPSDSLVKSFLAHELTACGAVRHRTQKKIELRRYSLVFKQMMGRLNHSERRCRWPLINAPHQNRS